MYSTALVGNSRHGQELRTAAVQAGKQATQLSRKLARRKRKTASVLSKHSSLDSVKATKAHLAAQQAEDAMQDVLNMAGELAIPVECKDGSMRPP